MAAADKAALHDLQMWVKQTHYEDRTLGSFGGVGGEPASARVAAR